MSSSPLHSAALPANLSEGYLACVAGEPSGDMLAASVLAGMKGVSSIAHLPTRGVGGPRMIAEGFDAEWPMETLAVRGYVEAIKQLPSILSLRRSLIKELLEDRPRAFLGIDAPDFNLGVEKRLKAAGIPTIHFISPSIWAWRGGRIKGIQESVDRMLCIFPFEPEIYHKVGMSATYVGHPLASQIPMVPDTAAAKLKLGVGSDKALVAIMPGSRQSEVAMIAPGFLKAMVLMHQQYGSDMEFVLPIATPALKPAIDALLQPILAQHTQLTIHLLDGQASLALEACDVVLIASGTATLEAALWKKPMVISYQVPALTAWIMRKQAYLPYVGLPNILAGKFIVPELLQEQGRPEALAQAIVKLLDQSSEVSLLKERFTEMHHTLNLPTGQLVAEVIAEVVEGSHV
jgi:lipid-A-disaccharide synthase